MASGKARNLDASEGEQLALNYRQNSSTVPTWVQEVIETQLAIDAEDAKSAGSLGFMTRALVLATMPYKDPKADVFQRKNGDFTLRILAGYEGGIPYGIYPRLLVSWIATEAVRTQSPVLELGDSLVGFLQDVVNVQASGGKNGTRTRVTEQMKRLFGSFITAQYAGGLESRGFSLRNVAIVEEADISGATLNQLDQLDASPEEKKQNSENSLWIPQPKEVAGEWRSTLRLTPKFYEECVDRPVPIDMRAYKALRRSPLAMDVYTWLSYRLSYTTKPTRPIPWVALMGQFGSNFDSQSPSQVRDFKKAFIKALGTVSEIYTKARYSIEPTGLVLIPSQPHVAKELAIKP